MSWKDQVISFLVQYGFRILGAIAILVCGFFLAKFVGNAVRKLLSRFQLEPPVKALLVMVARVIVIALTLVLVLERLGVNITPLVAGIGVVGVGVGLATQGVLSNLIAGLLIMFTKPFRVGEYIELLGINGVVQNIDLFSTFLLHFDKSIVVVPNRKISGEILHNYGTIRQLDLSIRTGYEANLDQAEAAIRQALTQNPRVLQDPAPSVSVGGLDESSISWNVRPWVKVADFTAAPGELYRAMMRNFAAAQIEIPFPQREVRVLNDAHGRGDIPAHVSAGYSA